MYSVFYIIQFSRTHVMYDNYSDLHYDNNNNKAYLHNLLFK